MTYLIVSLIVIIALSWVYGAHARHPDERPLHLQRGSDRHWPHHHRHA